ncbi:MAG: hypothetical protein AAFV72_25920 [Cyanobacteria bacterium J06635_1]
MSSSDQQSVERNVATRADLLRIYAEQDAMLGSPNPRYKQCKLYCDRYLNIRVQLVGTDGLNDTDWDLTIF